MSSLPNEIFCDIANFLPNDDITDLMLTSRTFNSLVTPRLRKIDQEMATLNQSIKSPVREVTDCEWISQMNLKRFEPIGSAAKKRMKQVFEILGNRRESNDDILRFKEGMSLERFGDATFLRILNALLSKPEFRREYNISLHLAESIQLSCNIHLTFVILEQLNLS
ncbi:f-box-like domain-containing protein [Ditylenchus destructor]|nr:f-box-like domain-containing protein [Ditylenchus destructor]